MATTLPVVDLRLGRAGGKARQELAETAVAALTGAGFLYLEGVDGHDTEELHTLCSWFFGLPLEHRMAISKKMFLPSSKYTYRGYFPVQEGEQSHKEAFEMGSFLNGPGEAPNEESKLFFEDNQWPDDPRDSIPFAAQFRESMESYYRVLTQGGLELLALVAEAWGAPPSLFTTMFQPHHLSTFRLLHYPPRGEEVPDCARKDGYILQCDEHQDSGFVTMLETFSYRGLQLQGSDGRWRDVDARPGALVVNIGILFSKITGGVLKATPHRVVDYGGDRFSIPFFLEPSYGTNVNQMLPGAPESGMTSENRIAELQPTGPKMSYGRWLLRNLITYIEYDSLKSLVVPE